MHDLPTYSQYKHEIDLRINSGEITDEQGIILMHCFRATLVNTPVHINYLMQSSGLNWKRANAVLNGLVMRGAIRKIEQKYYMV